MTFQRGHQGRHDLVQPLPGVVELDVDPPLVDPHMSPSMDLGHRGQARHRQPRRGRGHRQPGQARERRDGDPRREAHEVQCRLGRARPGRALGPFLSAPPEVWSLFTPPQPEVPRTAHRGRATWGWLLEGHEGESLMPLIIALLELAAALSSWRQEIQAARTT